MRVISKTVSPIIAMLNLSTQIQELRKGSFKNITKQYNQYIALTNNIFIRANEKIFVPPKFALGFPKTSSWMHA